ncbi:hypothetical protein EDB83DRAFT_2319519 [Lactarius deliciosus]|nr:hypothetical protein EDB83DRAFT_2319519 [Lactarius deliciosus]
MHDGGNEREERDMATRCWTETEKTENRQFWGQRPRDPYTSWGVKILTVPGQASSSSSFEDFSAENGGIVVYSRSEEGEGGLDGGAQAACGDEGVCLQLALAMKRVVKILGSAENRATVMVRDVSDGEDSKGGGVLVRILSNSEGAEVGREEVDMVVKLAMVKTVRVLGFHLKTSSCAWYGVEANPLGSNTKLGSVTPTAGEVFTLTLKFVHVGGKGLAEIQNRDGRNGEWEREVDGVGGELLGEVETCSMSLGGCCGGSESGDWDEKSTSGGTTRGGDISPTVGWSQLAKDGVKRGHLAKDLGSEGSMGTMSLDDKGRCSRELSETAPKSSWVDSSSRSPSVRDGDSVADEKLLDVGRTGNIEGNGMQFSWGSAGETGAISGTFPGFGESSERAGGETGDVGICWS